MNDVQPFDNELLKEHLALAAERLPGPDYYTILRWIHERLRPANYVEIGIRKGDSLRLALNETRCIGVDPVPCMPEPLPENMNVFTMTSDEFFKSQHLPDLIEAPAFSLAFIDGLHLFEQALRDFINLERFASSESIVMLHDCLPLDALSADRTRTTHFYSGDVWKLTMCLKIHRPDLMMKMIRTPPTGLCLVGNLDPHSQRLNLNYDGYVSEYLPLSYADFDARRGDMPASIGNTREEVTACVAQMLAH